MRTISAALKAHLAGETTTMCNIWDVVLKDGSTRTFTDNVEDIAFEGKVYLSSSGFITSNISTSNTLNVDNLEVNGALVSPTITEVDAIIGIWDAAKITLRAVNYKDLTMGSMYLRSGTIGIIRTGRTTFTAELRGVTQPLQQNMLEHYSPSCRAHLGDSRCKVDMFTLPDAVILDRVRVHVYFSLSNYNLTAKRTDNVPIYTSAFANVSYSSGLHYWECKVDGMSASSIVAFGVATSATPLVSPLNTVGCCAYISSGSGCNGVATIAIGGAYTAGDVVGIALDADAGAVTYFLNGVQQGAAISCGINTWFPVMVTYRGLETVTMNFGQYFESPLVYAPPLGYSVTTATPNPLRELSSVTSVLSSRSWLDAGLTRANSVVSKAITGITNANPAVVTSTGHTFTSGQQIAFSGVNGMVQLNGKVATATYIDANHYSINVNTLLTTGNYSAYTSGGLGTLYQASEYYTNGVVTWISGGNTGLKMEVKKYTVGFVELFQPMPYQINAGDTYTITAGCDKNLQTCSSRFNNVINFRGEPHLSGNDAISRHA